MRADRAQPCYVLCISAFYNDSVAALLRSLRSILVLFGVGTAPVVAQGSALAPFTYTIA